ncbi:hypothetical protein [Oleiharenicola lentus]|uniref:hypothetical protein n=1 Tax=Oleiharenicola lentus TaxID=2508720 RepID=UPI003F66241A
MTLRSATTWRALLLGVMVFSSAEVAVRAQETVPIGGSEEGDDPPGDPEVEAGWLAFRDGRQTEAQAIWRKAAAAGKASAYAGLGKMYWWGSGVAQDAAEARRLYALGAEKKDPDSLMDLAEMLMLGEGGAKDLAQSRKLLDEARAVGGPSQASRAQLLIQTLKVQAEEENRLIDEREREEFLKNDRRPGADDFRAGFSYHETSLYKEAAERLTRAASLDHPAALGLLGNLYSSGDGVPKDQEEARQLYARGAVLGDVDAMLALGWAWLDGRGGPQDKAQAKYWFQKAATLPTANRRQRELATVDLNDLKGVTIAANAIPVAAPKLLGKSAPAAPVVSPAPTVAKVAAVAAAKTSAVPTPVVPALAELTLPELKLDKDGKPELPFPVLKPHGPMALERAWRAKISAAISARGSLGYARAIALQEYLDGLKASALSEAEKNSAARVRIEEIALEDFFAVGTALPATKRKDWAHVLTEAERQRFSRFDEVAWKGRDALTQAGFPEGLGVAKSDLYQAERELKVNDHAGRLTSLRAAAAKGSPEAMLLIAEIYRNGQGVPADPVLAVRWTYFAATKHHAPAMLQLAQDAEKGVAAGGPARMNAWRGAARRLPPPIRAEPRVSFAAESYDFAAYVSTMWDVTIRFSNGKTVKTNFLFAQSGSGFALTYDALSVNAGSVPVWTTQKQYSTYDSRTYTVLNFQFAGRNFTGNLNGGYLDGRFDVGTWNATRRADLGYVKLGDEARAHFRPDDALYYYSKAIEEKRAVLNFQKRSSVYYSLADFEPAIADLDEALQLDPQDPISLVNRSLAHLGAENYPATVADATAGLGLAASGLTDEMRTLLFRTRAQAHFRSGNDAAAKSDYADARKLDPKQPLSRDEMLLDMMLANREITKAFQHLGEHERKMNEEFQKLNESQKAAAPATASEPPKKE